MNTVPLNKTKLTNVSDNSGVKTPIVQKQVAAGREKHFARDFFRNLMDKKNKNAVHSGLSERPDWVHRGINSKGRTPPTSTQGNSVSATAHNAPISIAGAGFAAQSDEFEEQAATEFLPRFPSFFTDSCRQELQSRIGSCKEWIYGGRHRNESFIEHYIKIPNDLSAHISLIEDVLILSYSLYTSRSKIDRYHALITFSKLRGSRWSSSTILIAVATDIFRETVQNEGEKSKYDATFEDIRVHVLNKMNNDGTFKPQSLEDTENFLGEMRKLLGMYDRIKETPLYKKMYKFMLYVLTLGLLDGVNIDFNSCNFSKWEAEAVKKTHRPGLDMIHCMLDTITFICDRGLQFFKTGDSSTFLHSGGTYEKWLIRCNNLLTKSRYMADPNFDKFELLSDVKESIEQGKGIMKFAAGLDKAERKHLTELLNRVQLLEMEMLTKKAAQATRKDPFAILVHGASSICKTQLKQALFYYYGKRFGRRIDSHFMYTRSPADPFWSGFDSTMWCIVLDDIAFQIPKNEIDPTLLELLNVVNSTPFCPPQAELADKGKTPLNCELVIATTNTRDLNLTSHFSCPFAVARRFKYVVTARVRPEFSKHGVMADSSKIPATEYGNYMDIWSFEVLTPQPLVTAGEDKILTRYVTLGKYKDIEDLLDWFGGAAQEHLDSQNKAMAAENTMFDMKLCNVCFRPEGKCVHTQFSENITEVFNPQSEDIHTNVIDFLETTNTTFIFRFKLWLISQILSGQTANYVEWIDSLWIRFDTPMLMMIAVVLVQILCLYPKTVLGIYILILIALLIRIHLWYLLSLLCQWRYGSMWRYRLAWSLCRNELLAWRLVWYITGERIRAINFTTPKLTKLRVFLASSMVLGVLVSLFRPAAMQAQTDIGTAPKPAAYEKPAYYYHNPYKVCNVDISGQSKCAQGSVVLGSLMRNTARFIIREVGSTKCISTTGVNYKGQLWLCNRHALDFTDSRELDIILDDVECNVSRSTYGVKILPSMIRHLSGDISVIELRCMQPGKALINYFPKDKVLEGKYAGVYVMRSRQGMLSQLPISNIRTGTDPCFKGGIGYFGNVTTNTEKGDCGSMCLGFIDGAQVILGLHTCGAPGQVFFQHISQKMLLDSLITFEPQFDMGVIPISAPGYERSLVETHPRAAVRWLERGQIEVLGSFGGFRPKHKSKVCNTFIHDYALKYGYFTDCGPPDMSYMPWHHALKDITKKDHSIDVDRLDRCVDAYTQDVLDGLSRADPSLANLESLHVYDLETALNGADGIAFVDGINTSTSAGNPFKTSKKKFLEFDASGKIDYVDPVILARMEEILDCYSRGVMFHPQFCAHLKDEPLPARKIRAGKTRVFAGAELAWCIVVRMYTLSLIRLIMTHPYIFESMVGVVAQSLEWQDLYNYITYFGPDMMIAGDYEAYDKRISAVMMHAAFRFFVKICRVAGWKDEDILILWGIGLDMSFVCIEINGELYFVQMNPSGHPLTVIINCIVNALYMRYAFDMISGKSVTLFKLYVHLVTYGDDNLMNVSPLCTTFNHTRISVALMTIGVKYTMAAKEAASVPFIHIGDCSFLKRTFRPDEDLGVIMAPLDESSIHKMLLVCTRPQIAMEAHSVAVIGTALREYFFYGKNIFLKKRSEFIEMCKDSGLNAWLDTGLPTYDDLARDFAMRSISIIDKAIKNRGSIPFQTGPSGLTFPKLEKYVQKENKNMQSRESLPGCAHEPKNESVPPGRENICASWEQQSDMIDSKMSDKPSMLREVITTFVDSKVDTATSVGAANHGFALGDATRETNISNWFSRPVRISKFTWLESMTTGVIDPVVYTTIPTAPWGLWCGNNFVQPKLNNYAFMRGDLKLKFQITASPFYYGMLKIVYTPLPYVNPAVIVDSTTGNEHLISYSQRPHITIVPGEATSYEMTLPFINNRNFIDIGQILDINNFGKLQYVIYSPLKSANASTNAGISITCYAWMDNIALSGATVEFSAQSDEYDEAGVISGPASAVAAAAGALESVPIIGPFATATRIGADAVSSIAKLFGYSNPPVIMDTLPFRSEPFPKLAATSISHPVEKLTVDAKQELSIDPQITGLATNADELNLAYLCRRESWLTKASWTSAKTVDTVLFATRINPFMFDTVTPTAPAAMRVYMVPMAFAANCFNAWRGSLIFRFRIVNSRFHKGRLLISYDPSGTSSRSIYDSSGDNATGVVHSAIVDIEMANDLEFVVDYQQPAQFLTMRSLFTEKNFSVNTSPPNFTTTGYDGLYDNGLLTVRVLNTLSGPTATNDIDVHVFVKAGEDIEFANPTEVDPKHRLSYFTPQSDVYMDHPPAAEITQSTGATKDELYLLHYGERVTSLRQLIRRYSLLQTERFVVPAANNSQTVIRKVLFKAPISPGYVSAGSSPYLANNQLSAGTSAYNWCNMTVMSYIAPAFLCQRGGTNYTFNFDWGSAWVLGSFRAIRRNQLIVGSKISSTITNSVTTSASAFSAGINGFDSGAAGSALTHTRTNTGLNVYLPNQSPFKFCVTTPIFANGGDPNDGSLYDALEIEARLPLSVGLDSYRIDTYVAAGTDFTLNFFLNVPTMYYYTSVPTAP